MNNQDLPIAVTASEVVPRKQVLSYPESFVATMTYKRCWLQESGSLAIKTVRVIGYTLTNYKYLGQKWLIDRLGVFEFN